MRNGDGGRSAASGAAAMKGVGIVVLVIAVVLASGSSSSSSRSSSNSTSSSREYGVLHRCFPCMGEGIVVWQVDYLKIPEPEALKLGSLKFKKGSW